MSKEVTTERNFKFGVEIEFLQMRSDALRTMIESINDRGVQCSYEGYTHRVMRGWKVVTDSSCGLEIVSPILYDFEELKVICEELKKANAQVTRECGIHVHHDVNDMNVEEIKNVFKFYVKHEDTIDSMLPKSRRANNGRYCGSMKQDIEEIKTVDSVDGIVSAMGTRFKKVNIKSYLTYGTLEFRQHSGSIEFDKISNWVLLTHKIVERAKNGKAVKETTPARLRKWAEKDLHRMFDFYKELGINGTKLAKFIRDRRKNFGVTLTEGI